MMQNSVSFIQLIDWLEGRMNSIQARELEALLSEADPTTQENLAWLRAWVQIKGRIKPVYPPAELRQKLLNDYKSQLLERRGSNLLKRFLAELVSDSGLNLATMGIRSAGGPANSRQLVYAADVADIAITFETRLETGTCKLMGQLFPSADDTLEAPGGVVVQLLQKDIETAITKTSDLGEFEFDGLLPGNYELIFAAQQVEIEIPTLEVGL